MPLLSPAGFDSLFTSLMHRAPRPGETTELYALSRGVPADAVCLIGQIPEFVREHPSFIPRPLAAATSKTIVNGIPVILTDNDWVYSSARVTGEYEPWVASVLRQTLEPGSVFVDVGANIGIHSALGSALVGDKGQVYAIEASIEVAAVTLAQARYTGRENMVVIPAAVTDRKRLAMIMADSGASNRFVKDEKTEHQKYTYEPILTDTLDALLRHLDRLDLIKIDIEGREGSALRGAEALLERFRPRIVAEHHFASPEHWFVDELVARGYEMTVLSAGAPVAVGQNVAALKDHCANGVYVDIFFSPKEAAFVLDDTRPRNHVFAGDSQRIQSRIGVRENGALTIEATAPAFAIYGPYLSLPPGKYRAAVDLSTRSGSAKMDVCHKGGTVVLARGGDGSLDFDIADGATDLEIRLFVPDGFAGSVRKVSVCPRD